MAKVMELLDSAGRRSSREHYIGLQGNQLFCKHLRLFCAAMRKAIVNANIVSLRPSKPFERLPEYRVVPLDM